MLQNYGFILQKMRKISRNFAARILQNLADKITLLKVAIKIILQNFAYEIIIGVHR
jgi:hypothetical protein